jgi:UDP-N-acetylglucosamine--N-acetylmuramyl-(pentapeptide) pyrophosphoryl-undecaprenol N-acetylglucosamine transferase
MDGFVFAGGGSGGHLFPAIAVARELKRRVPDAPIVFVGGGRPIEGDILSREPFERRRIEAASSADLKRSPFRSAWRYWTSVREASRWLREFRPRAVIGCGGYASVPVAMAMAAGRARIRLVLLEQNIVPGRATSWLARRAQTVCVSFDETVGQLPRGTHAIVTGNPVREEIIGLATGSRGRANAKPTLLVLGGSQGAASVNAGMLDFVAQRTDALSDWRVVHQTGAQDEWAVRGRYAELSVDADVRAFIVDMAAAYRQADVVISRAGATTLAELACAGLPAVLIPYPGAVRDHQRRNAEAFVRAGAAVCAMDGSPTELTGALVPLLTDAERRRRMSEQMAKLARPDATQRVVEAILTASGRVPPRRPLESRL